MCALMKHSEINHNQLASLQHTGIAPALASGIFNGIESVKYAIQVMDAQS